MIPPDNGIPPFPTPRGQIKPTLEILPGLVVEPRFINGNWYLIPVSKGHQLPDVEGMVIKDLAVEIEAGEMTMGDKCCLIEALAHRREANIEALRNVMGLLATDKPMPLTEVPPLAAVMEEDQALNDLPTAAETGVQEFDFIEYNYTQSQDPERLGPFYPDDWSWVWLAIPYQGVPIPPRYFGLFEHGETVRIYLIDKITGERISVYADTILKHWAYEFPPEVYHGYTLDHIRFTKPSTDATYYDTWERIGPYGPGPGIWHEGVFYNQYQSDDPVVAIGEASYPGLCCWDVHPEWWPGGKAIGLVVGSWQYGTPQPWGGNLHPTTMNVGIVVERMDYSLYGIDLTLGYYNHSLKILTMEARRYENNFPHQGILAEAAAAEIILLDDIRLNGLINAPQYALGKERLEVLRNTPITW